MGTKEVSDIDPALKDPSLVYPNPAPGAQVEKGIGANKTRVGAKLSPGVYFIKIDKGGSREILKVVKR